MDQPIVGIRFVEAGPITYCSPGDLDLGPNDYVIVRTERGEQFGWVVVAPDQVIAQTIEGPVRVVDRLASADDVEAYRQQKRRAEEDLGRAQALATRLDPRIRVASLSYSLAGDHAHLTYTAKENGNEDRFERELSRHFDAGFSVEQVGDRDRAKALGGLGQCGRALCCATWMTEFPAISIKMAKDQGLAPNPSKISGVCGRLLCCLSFEVEAYRSILGTLPKVGKRVTTPVGRAKVLSINALTEMVRLRFDDGGAVIEIPAEQLRQQYGTAVRPEELEQDVEGPLHEEDRRRREAFLAALEPVTKRPPQWEPEERGSTERATGRPGSRPNGARDQRRDSRRESTRDGGRDGGRERPAASAAGPATEDSSTRRRGRRGSGAGNSPGGAAGAPGSGGESVTTVKSGIRIARRRSARVVRTSEERPAPDERTTSAQPPAEATLPSPSERAPGSRPQSPAPQSGGEASDAQSAERRGRRRGRRGGRRRRGGVGSNGGAGEE